MTSAFQVCCHFYHQEFERCRIVDKHMNILAQKYFDTKFIKIHAPDAPFFVDKLQIQVLPCIVFFRNGVAYDRIVGFEELGARDDFPTAKLEGMLLAAGIIAPRERKEDDSEDEEEVLARERAKRITYGFTVTPRTRTAISTRERVSARARELLLIVPKSRGAVISPPTTRRGVPSRLKTRQLVPCTCSLPPSARVRGTGRPAPMYDCCTPSSTSPSPSSRVEQPLQRYRASPPAQRPRALHGVHDGVDDVRRRLEDVRPDVVEGAHVLAPEPHPGEVLHVSPRFDGAPRRGPSSASSSSGVTAYA